MTILHIFEMVDSCSLIVNQTKYILQMDKRDGFCLTSSLTVARRCAKI